MNALSWITIATQILFISTASVPSCQISDSECLKTSAQSAVQTLTAGIPDIGAEGLDVLHLDKINIELAGLTFNIKDAEVKGLKKSTISSVKVNEKKKILEVVYSTDIVLKGKYSASGQLLVLPISGNGDATFKLKNCEVHLFMPFELKKDGDATYMDLKSISLKYDVKDGAHFALTNLFNGNEDLSDAMLKFMNENWKVLTQEFGIPILETAHKKIFDSMKKYVATQPILGA